MSLERERELGDVHHGWASPRKFLPFWGHVDAFGNIEYEDVEAYITGEKVKAVFAVNLLGFAADLPRLKTLCADNDVILLEDNCESFGAKTYYDNDKLTGTYGKMASLSFFFSHHLSTMEGGMILTNKNKIYSMFSKI